jgi:hypothetical protein
VTSTSHGDATFRVAASAKSVVAKILGPPAANANAVNVGLTTKRRLPEKFDFRFYNLPVNTVFTSVMCSPGNGSDSQTPGAKTLA